MSPAELGTKHDCAGEDQKQFTATDPTDILVVIYKVKRTSYVGVMSICLSTCDLVSDVHVYYTPF
jgi:hypothetical protein